MTEIESQVIISEYFDFLNNKLFPCIGAKAALARRQIKCMVVDHMACPKDDKAILQFLYDFVEDYSRSDKIFHSAAIIFKNPLLINEYIFDKLLWERLQSLADLDQENFASDKRVDADPASANFSFSLKEEAFFIIGLHPGSSRLARQFKYPALAFNPHEQFEKLKETNRYEMMKKVVRKRDILYSGSANPMLEDFGKSSEAGQYSGRNYDGEWQCPLQIRHAEIKHHSAP